MEVEEPSKALRTKGVGGNSPEAFDPRERVLCGEDPVMGPQTASVAGPGLPPAPGDLRGLQMGVRGSGQQTT